MCSPLIYFQGEDMSNSVLIAHCGASKVDREFLKTLPLPEATRTHQPIPHIEIVEALIEALSFRHINVVRDEYAVTPNGMRCFGLIQLEYGFEEVQFAIGFRNSNDKSLRLAMTVGYKVFICDNLSFKGGFTPILAKHPTTLTLI